MSDDFHRPTLTFPAGAYNATQVRLYGIAAEAGLVYPQHSKSEGGVDINVTVNTGLGDEPEAEIKKLEEMIKYQKMKRKLSEAEIFLEMANGLLPIPPIPIVYSSQLKIDIKQYGTLVISASVSLKTTAANKKILSCGVIVGYSYEGHCYDLPKPKIMIIPDAPRPIPIDDCGYDDKSPEHYMLWIVDKLDECVEFEMNQGFVEQLVLEANLPGKRSPTMYAGRMMLGHRSGRLTD